MLKQDKIKKIVGHLHTIDNKESLFIYEDQEVLLGSFFYPLCKFSIAGTEIKVTNFTVKDDIIVNGRVNIGTNTYTALDLNISISEDGFPKKYLLSIF